MAAPGSAPGTWDPNARSGGPSSAAGHSGGQQEPSVGERIQEASDEAQDAIRRQAERASGKAESLKEEAKQRAGRLLDDAKERARSAIDERKEGFAQDVGHFAHALRASASDLQDHHKGYVAQYVEQAATSVDQIADTLSRQDLRDLMRHTENFARRQPGLFIGGAVAAGFALARFLKSSAERRAVEEPEVWDREDRETWEREPEYRTRAGVGPMPSASTSSYAATPGDRLPGREDAGHDSF
jgi:hypothetical protein